MASLHLHLWLSGMHKFMRDGHSHGDAGGKSTPMDKDAAARIQSAEARKGGGGVEKGGFASRAQVSAVPIHCHCSWPRQ